MKTVALTLILAFAYLCTGPSDARAASSERTFAIMELVPYGFLDSDEAPAGYLYESAQALLEATGSDFTLMLMPLKRMLLNIKKEPSFCTFIARTPLAESILDFIEPVGQELVAGIYPQAGKALNRYEDMADYTVAVPLGVSGTPRFDADEALKKVRTRGYAHGVRMLAAGRVDAIYGNLDSYRYFAKKIGKDPDTLFGKPLVFANFPLFLACNPTMKDQAEIDVFRATTKKFRENGTFRRIIQRYQ